MLISCLPEHRYCLISLYCSFILVKELLIIQNVLDFVWKCKGGYSKLFPVSLQVVMWGWRQKVSIISYYAFIIISNLFWLISALGFDVWFVTEEKNVLFKECPLIFNLLSQNLRDEKSLDFCVLEEINT